MNLRTFPDPILRHKSRAIRDFTDRSLAHDIEVLSKILRTQPHSIGIAAPQAGSDWRLAIVDVSTRIPQGKRLILVNPVIVERSDPILSREGCMSFPDYRADIQRYKNIRAIWQDETGKRYARHFCGIEAVCIQHEVDHLNGILFIDHVVSLRRDLIPRKVPG